MTTAQNEAYKGGAAAPQPAAAVAPVAAGFMSLLGMLPQPPGFDMPRLVRSTAILAIGSLSIAGIVAGLYPARKAALLEPVEALRRE